ncbi:MAG: NAD(P)/FAD-dependent oxidoreductase [Chitinophagaceae bacterium]|nr:NAD(P)/FAD-dependent oxidoreductase [Chitinophagaceae bacterium]
MKLRVVVLGAGFGGLELSTILSETIGDHLELTLIDRSDSFYFGFSKLDVMFGRKAPGAVKLSYSHIVKPGVQFRQEIITAIDPVTRKVVTDKGRYDADVLVVALGADYDINATPGLAEGGNEFYTFHGAERLREVIPGFTKGHAIIGVTSAPFKCPPAPSEAALLLHDYLTERGIRNSCEISIVIPFGLPIPPSPDTSNALLAAFAERNIRFIPNHRVRALDPSRQVAILDDDTELPFDLFLGIPKHCAPEVLADSGLTVNGWIPVDRNNLKTRFPNVYAIGDVTSVGTPKAGVFAEGAARIAAASIIAELKGGETFLPYSGAGSCYVEFGQDLVGRVDVDFFSGPKPTGIFKEPSDELVRDKQYFGSSRAERWFGL